MTDGATVLVDFFYAQPVGHAVEALHHALAVQRADPSRRVSVLLNAATPVELASCCPWLDRAYAVRSPFLEPAPDALAALAHVPRDWDWVLDDPRRHQPVQRESFAGMVDHYAASDAWLRPREGRRPLGYPPPSRSRHEPLRLELPAAARAAAAGRLPGRGGPLVALLPAGSGPAAQYPSARSWGLVLDALREALPGLGVVLVGRRVRDERTSTGMPAADLARLAAHPAVVADVLDVPLLEQLAAVQRCGLLLSPHSGFGMAAMAVGTPWLTLSGGRWFEWWFDHVPFRSVVPDVRRFPAYSQFGAEATVPDGDGGERVPSMVRERVQADLHRVVAAADELLRGAVPYERCLDDYVRDLVAAHGGDASALWSFDDVHREHLPGRLGG
ncbi:hypothetical protein [Vallicoccus soli]|uniref:Glycosyltransferase family 9 protein n=1 Tax=Vallicoccus soli TaxID=2339232 RepID=A0A3A3YZW6_9ACTN|nr:hypothetical protein [Vallicoccus soli]RJK97510.1 hypothetical protein D5H78_00215 [Vallicoccus soli]